MSPPAPRLPEIEPSPLADAILGRARRSAIVAELDAAAGPLTDFRERRAWARARMESECPGVGSRDQAIAAKAALLWLLGELVSCDHPPAAALIGGASGLLIAPRNLPTAMALAGVRPGPGVPAEGVWDDPASGLRFVCADGECAVLLLPFRPRCWARR